MQPVHLFDLAWRHATWASTRQAVIGGNIANADTPGFRARDVAPFSVDFAEGGLQMATTSPLDIAPDAPEVATREIQRGNVWDTKHSGNTVSLDEELVKANDASRSYGLDMSVMRSFNRLLAIAVKSA